MMNTNYCYLDDALKTPFLPSKYVVMDGKAKIGELDYQDPDATSQKLYEDLAGLWSRDLGNVLLSFEKHTKWLNLVDKSGRRYASDYIGPSRAWANYVGMTDLEIGTFLQKARTIGGHMLWPVHQIPTINTARGGGQSVYDRFDLTLAELRNYFMGQEYWFKESLWNMFEKEEEWLSIFRAGAENGLVAFKQFIDYWQLNDFVYGKEYEVISLATSDLEKGKVVPVSKAEPIFPANYKGYFEKSIRTLASSDDREYAETLKEAYRQLVKNNLWVIAKRNERIAQR